MLYRVALGTGFRANELRSLTPESFDLDGEPPTVTVEAGYSKRRRMDEQPIRRDLAELLREWLADKTPGKRVFALGDKPAKMMREDLQAAGIPYRDAGGRVADFHSLRACYISGIQRGGASVKVVQELARHSDPKLTLNTYTHLRVSDKTAALEALPGVGDDEPEREALRATGTYDATPDGPAMTSGEGAAHMQRAGAPKSDSVRLHATGQGESATAT